MDVDEVGDEFHGHALVVQQHPDGPRFAVVQGGHAVEQVGGHAGPRVHGRPDGVPGGVGVPDRGQHTRVREPPDRVQRPGQLRGECDHVDAVPPRRQQRVHGGGVRFPQGRRIVGPAAGPGEERPLQVDARQLPVGDQVGQGGHPVGERRGGCRDQAREGGGGAVRAVGGQRGGRLRGAGRVRAAPAAVAVQIDEAGDDQRPVQGDPVARRRLPGPDTGDPVSGHGEPAVVEHRVGYGEATPGQDEVVVAGHGHRPSLVVGTGAAPSATGPVPRGQRRPSCIARCSASSARLAVDFTVPREIPVASEISISESPP